LVLVPDSCLRSLRTSTFGRLAKVSRAGRLALALTVCTLVHTLSRGVQAITILDEGSDEEERFVTLGIDALGRVLVVIYTWRGDRPRLISARKATPLERRQYEGAR
jgi:uncharacterized DUF497 family protein